AGHRARFVTESWSAVAAPPAAPRSPDEFLAQIRQKRFRGTVSAEYHRQRELGSRGAHKEVTLRGKSGHQRARAVGNAHPGKPAGKCHREQTADGAATREPRTGKGERVR